ncbi:hypothetical protein AAVH_27833 [Aphelenchoides avenae]|nr:hypothetical protein AAVH_27833 [Aphelenchus avenae]
MVGEDFLKQYSKLSLDRRSLRLSLPDDKEKEYSNRGQLLPPSLTVSKEEAYRLIRLKMVSIKEVNLVCGSYQYFKNVTFSGGNGSKLAGLVNVLPRYFPSLEVLELNVRAEEKLDEYLFHDVGVDELSRFVTRVDWMTVLLESTLRNCVPSCKIEVTYSLRLDCVYDSDPETPEYPENATAMYSELPRLDKFPGFAIDQAAIDEYETNDEIDRPPAEKAVCFIKETQVSDVLKLTVLCHICRYESLDKHGFRAYTNA